MSRFSCMSSTSETGGCLEHSWQRIDAKGRLIPNEWLRISENPAYQNNLLFDPLSDTGLQEKILPRRSFNASSPAPTLPGKSLQRQSAHTNTRAGRDV